MAKVLWFTGLSGSGKTTIAEKLAELLSSKGLKVKIFDGDDVRKELHKHLGFTPEDIKENNRLIVGLCLNHSKDFDIILVPVISPFRESREDARKSLGQDFIEVYVKCSLDTCINRDVKGHYKKALAGEIKNFIGIAKENPYEPPKNPEILIDSEKESADLAVKKILDYLK